MLPEPSRSVGRAWSAVLVLAALGPFVGACGSGGQQTVSPELSALDQATDDLASALLSGLQQKGIKRVAVLDIEDAGGEPRVLTRLLAQDLSDRLSEMQTAITVLDRHSIEKILQEQKLTGSGLFDSTTTADLGKMLAAEALIRGEIAVSDSGLRVSARAISVETLVLIASGSVQLPKGTVPALLLAPPADLQPMGLYAEPPKPKVFDSWEGNGLRVEATDVWREPNRKSAGVALRLTNLTDDEIRLGVELQAFGKGKSYLYDGDRQVHPAYGDGRGPGIRLVGKTAKESDYSVLKPGVTEVSMVYRANKDRLISGDWFWIEFRLVFLVEGKPVRRDVKLKELVLNQL